MTVDPYLIAHLVRGTPAFDIAHRLPCPECQSYESVTGEYCESRKPQSECDECERLGYWWIVGTSGHRAYPWWDVQLIDLSYMWDDDHHSIMKDVSTMPSPWPDHYPTRSTPKSSGSSLLAALSLHLSTQRSAPIKRRV
jgi:hypothetical protein